MIGKYKKLYLSLKYVFLNYKSRGKDLSYPFMEYFNPQGGLPVKNILPIAMNVEVR